VYASDGELMSMAGVWDSLLSSLGSAGVAGWVLWQLFTRTLPRILASFEKSLDKQRVDFTAALNQQRKDFEKTMEWQRESSREHMASVVSGIGNTISREREIFSDQITNIVEAIKVLSDKVNKVDK
jgi:hypothetical protein